VATGSRHTTVAGARAKLAGKKKKTSPKLAARKINADGTRDRDENGNVLYSTTEQGGARTTTTIILF